MKSFRISAALVVFGVFGLSCGVGGEWGISEARNECTQKGLKNGRWVEFTDGTDWANDQAEESVGFRLLNYVEGRPEGIVRTFRLADSSLSMEYSIELSSPNSLLSFSEEEVLGTLTKYGPDGEVTHIQNHGTDGWVSEREFLQLSDSVRYAEYRKALSDELLLELMDVEEELEECPEAASAFKVFQDRDYFLLRLRKAEVYIENDTILEWPTGNILNSCSGKDCSYEEVVGKVLSDIREYIEVEKEEIQKRKASERAKARAQVSGNPYSRNRVFRCPWCNDRCSIGNAYNSERGCFLTSNSCYGSWKRNLEIGAQLMSEYKAAGAFDELNATLQEAASNPFMQLMFGEQQVDIYEQDVTSGLFCSRNCALNHRRYN